MSRGVFITIVVTIGLPMIVGTLIMFALDEIGKVRNQGRAS